MKSRPCMERITGSKGHIHSDFNSCYSLHSYNNGYRAVHRCSKCHEAAAGYYD